ncbi:MAG TPA: carbohydrate ABC transporter permease [Clostridiales bacterium]|nr:carbohydrate ABC transporter permease [Clostridiales bacterium]
MREDVGRRSYRSAWGNAIIVLFMAVIAFFMALPLIYTISTAFKPINELFLYPPRFFVKNPTLKNMKDLFATMSSSYIPFSRYLFNSLLVSILGTAGHVFIVAMAAYAFAKHTFPGSKFFFNMIVFSLMFSGYVTGVPRFIIMSKIKILDTYLALILPMMASSLGLYLLKQFMEQMIVAETLESARIDGASEFKIVWNIVMPCVKPGWLTLILLSFKDSWGDINSPSLYIQTEGLKTLPQAMSYIQQGGIARMGAGAANTLLIMLPPILIFIITQSNVIETMKSSGMKG